MANVRKRISELTALTSASLDTTLVGVDRGTTYKIELDTLADAVTSRVNILDRNRLSSLESVTSSFETKGRGILSGSVSYTSLTNIPQGIISQSTDLSSLNTFTQSINSRVDNLESNTGSYLTSLDGAVSSSSQLTSSYDERYILSGSITETTWDNIANKPEGIVSQSTDLSSLNLFTQSAEQRIGSLESNTGSYLTSLNGAISGAGQIADLGFVTGAYAYLTEFNSLTQSFNVISGSVVNITNAVDVTQLNNTTASLNSFTQSIDGRVDSLENATSSYLTSLNGAISSSSQLTASYDSRYVLSGSITQTTWDNIANKPTGIISGSSQLTSSYDSRYSLSGSIPTVFSTSVDSRLDVVEGVSASAASALNGVSGAFATTIGNLGSTYATDSELNNVSGVFAISQASQDTLIASLRTNVVSSSVFTTFSTSVDSRLDNQEAFSSSLTTLSNKSTKILDSAPYTSAASWSGSYTGTGGTVKVEANFTLYSVGGNAVKTFTLFRNGVAVDSGSFFFNQQNVHHTMPTLYYVGTNETGTNTYSVGHDGTSDNNDYCTIVVTETFNSLNIEGSANYVQVLGNRVTNVSTTGVTLVSGSITTSGNPVQIMVTGDANPSGVTSYVRLQLFRNSTPIGNIVQAENTSNINVPYCLNVIDTPSAGTYTYSMRTVNAIGGNIDFGEVNGPVLTAVELKTNTNLPSLNNTFTGNNTFRGTTRFQTVGGDEGGEIEFGVPQTNTTLSTRVVADIYQNRLRIFDGNTNGVFIDLSKAPTGVSGELMHKASGFVNRGVDVTLGNLKARMAATGNASLQLSTVSGTYSVYGSGVYSQAGGVAGSNLSSTISITTTPTYIVASYNFGVAGAVDTWNIVDVNLGIAWRITMIVGFGYNNNFISIERLH